MKYAGMKWKNMTLKMCIIQLSLIDPSGYHSVRENGESYKCFLPEFRKKCYKQYYKIIEFVYLKKSVQYLIVKYDPKKLGYFPIR